MLEATADNAKLLAAYRIINQQLVKTTQKLKHDVFWEQERYVSTIDMLLKEREENKSLRVIVGKLKDQITMITKVMITVQEQSVNMFNVINRPHELDDEMVQNHSPRAQRVYDQRRVEFPPYVDEAAIPEEPDLEQDFDGSAMLTRLEATNQVECKTSLTEPTEDTLVNESDESSNLSFDLMASSSPLIQRLKRRSKNVSFDESFETIDRERVFKLSRRSHERRQINLSLRDSMSEQLSKDRLDRLSSVPPDHTITFENSDMEIDEPTQPAPLMERNKSLDLAEEEAKSEPKLAMSMQPMVLLQPLTLNNLKTHERKTQSQRKVRLRNNSKKISYIDTSSSQDETLETCSSMENLSVQSNESGRPRRKAAPTSLREPSIGSKMRRE